MRANLSAFLTTGTDYPVKAHSLISALPSRIIPSKGILMGSFKKTTSPGTTSMEDICLTTPFLKALMGI